MDNRQKAIGIVHITPSILEKRLVWFEHNDYNIKKEARKITSFWNTNYFEIQELELFPLSNLMRRLSDWGYTKVSEVKLPAEFANRGGILDIFPANNKHAYRLEYEGNMILSIIPLLNTAVKDEQKKLKDLIAKRPQLYSRKFSKKNEEAQKLLTSLTAGTYVVHLDHGIKGLTPSDRGELEITDIQQHYLKQGSLNVELLGRGTAWLDTGTHDSMLDATNFIQVLERRQSLKIGCPEEVAWRMKYIDDKQLTELAAPLIKSGYGEYLQDLIHDGSRKSL